MASESITFKASYGDLDSEVVLTRMGGGGYWNVNIDNYYRATVVFWDNVWEVRPHDPAWFELEDMQEISDRITDWEQAKKNNSK